MNYLQTWNEAVVASLQNLWSNIIGFIPQLVGALIVLIIGLIVSHFLSKLVNKLISLTNVDKLVHKIDATRKMEEVGVKFSLAVIIAWIVKWFFIIVTLIAVVDILKLTEVNVFLQKVVEYIPNVVVAVVILAIGLVVGQFVHDVVEKSTKASRVTAHTSHMLSDVAKWSLVIFTLLASLVQLGVATRLIETLFMGLVATLTISLGLAFGLGGKEHAGKWIDKMFHTSHHEQ